MGGHLLLPPSCLHTNSMILLWLPLAPNNANSDTNMYTLRHPKERAAALHLPPANAKGLLVGAAWALAGGEVGLLLLVVVIVEEAARGGRLLLPPTVVKRWCMAVESSCLWVDVVGENRLRHKPKHDARRMMHIRRKIDPTERPVFRCEAHKQDHRGGSGRMPSKSSVQSAVVGWRLGCLCL